MHAKRFEFMGENEDFFEVMKNIMLADIDDYLICHTWNLNNYFDSKGCEVIEPKMR